MVLEDYSTTRERNAPIIIEYISFQVISNIKISLSCGSLPFLLYLNKKSSGIVLELYGFGESVLHGNAK